MTEEETNPRSWYQTFSGRVFLCGMGIFLASSGIGSCVEGFKTGTKRYEMSSDFEDHLRDKRSFLSAQLSHPDISPEARSEILKEYVRNTP